PCASSADPPGGLAVDGAFDLDTLVVVPAGNEGDAGPTFGSLDGPAGAKRALTVAAIDPRPTRAWVHLSVFRGLDVSFDGRLPLLGAVVPPRARELEIGIPRGSGEQAADYFDAHGNGVVAGRAALVRAGGGPAPAAAAPSTAR